MEETDIYSIIGEDGFARLVAAFYRQVPQDDILGKMYPEEDRAGAEQRLRDFLIYRFGGPQRYIADGQYHPIQGFPELSSRATRVDANTMITEAKREDGSIVGGATKIVSADGKSITIDNFGYDSQLRQFKMRTVWDRQ